MSAFLSELADQLADKWVALLVGPGLLFLVAALGGGVVLGQEHWADWTRLARRATLIAKSVHSPVVVAVLAVVILVGSVAAGLVARGLGDLMSRLWMGNWKFPLTIVGTPLTDWRKGRWTKRNDAHRDGAVKSARMQVLRMQGGTVTGPVPDLAALAAARNAVGLVEPQRPTWMGDRMLAVDSRLFRFYSIDLNFAWSRLWMTLADSDRSDLTSAQGGLGKAARLAGWGFMYAVLGGWWWPSAVIGVAVISTGIVRAREAVQAYAELIESAFDVHVKDLAAALGYPQNGPLKPATGRKLTKVLRKGA